MLTRRNSTVRSSAASIFQATCLTGALICLSPAAYGATDADRIKALEERVAAQDELIRTLVRRLDEAAPRSAQPIQTNPVPAIPRVAEITTGEGITIKPRGRIQVDALLVNSGDGATPTGTQLRRFQIGAEGRLGGGFRYSAEASYAGSKLGLEDVLIAYQIDSGNEVLVGYFKPAITADDMASDNFTLLLERSAYANLFAPGRRIGIGYNHSGPN